MGTSISKILAVLVGVVTLYGCKSYSLSSSAEKQLKSLIIERDSLNTNLNELINWKELFESNTRVVVEEVIYDTDKPTLNETNKPPIKKEVKTTYENNQITDKETSSNITLKEDKASVKESIIDSNEKEEVKEVINKKNPLKYLSSILWAVFSIVIVFVVFKLLRKFNIL